MRPCFAFTAAAADDQPETLSIYDEIGFWGVQSKDFRASLDAVKSKVLNVEINSPGGDMFAGVAMYNMLRASGKEIVVKVMGVAASAASLIAMAGDKIIMPSNTMMMIHNPWTIIAGNAEELRETADALEKMGNSVVGTYVKRTGMKEAEMQALLATDTWLTADEALDKGFATEVVDEIKVSAKFDMARAELPENVKVAIGLMNAVDEPTAEELAAQELAEEEAEATRVEEERLAQEAAEKINADPVAKQISDLAIKSQLEDLAPFFAVNCADLAVATARIDRAREIKALCAFAKKSEIAAQMIKADKSLADARTELAAAMAKDDASASVDTAPRIKNQQTTSNSAGPKGVSAKTIWDSHNAQKVKKGS